ncbi:unnamed protein product [Rotaria socialis]|uniref:DUF4440 domain-containing protein n=1 Tax=Rotaria socialis TaxID=392032 RepID=A0A820G8V1_9BILA|nr:unnamed protein product [Rotaria socialis]CAF3372907.1 unnamed protein product [Rotaria socialis]CAF3468408.1 unnamed protein product [Rotaria socialis]CAF3589130.1 unnamed protein product [Rotaria socialis]CAF3613524.1 unnamed protein product [Rotaria socialis]
MSFDSIDKLNREFERCYNNGQVKEAVTTYASDGRLFATDKQVYEGLSQIEKYYAGARAAGNSKVELHTGQVIQCGSDYFIEISQYKINTDGGNYVVVWKTDGGQCKKIIDIFN